MKQSIGRGGKVDPADENDDLFVTQFHGILA